MPGSPIDGSPMTPTSTDQSRPYVVSWNLTYRCNLACEHCYLDAGAKKHQQVETPAFADRSELDTEQCYSVIDQIAEFAPECVTILTGGEPLLRKDILQIIRYASQKKLWVVVGTNGVLVTSILAEVLKKEGVRGLALSLDALKPEDHDKFRVVRGAWENTVQGAKVLAEVELPFIIQTTVGKHNLDELEAIADFAYEELAAKVWNLYFLVQTGRGQFVSDISAEEYDQVLASLSRIQLKYQNKMMVNAKCAPHYARTLFQQDADSPFLKTFSRGAGGCPAGTHYMGIRPNGDMTPCPYLPVFGGNLKVDGFADIWNESDVFTAIRQRDSLGQRCGSCEFVGVCGGCRARAYGMTEEYMAEDPLCSYQPGKYDRTNVESKFQIVYGEQTQTDDIEVSWEPGAKERLDKVPAFVRGMVIKSVESYCKKNGISLITAAELEKIRERMPTQKVFGKG